MNAQEKFDLITRNLEEVIGADELKKKLSGKSSLKVYWGTMTTGAPSIAYLFPMLKIADFLSAGCQVKILNADLHAALDGVPWGELEKRFLYYQELIFQILKVIGVDRKNLEFVKGSKLELNPKYFEDLLKLSTLTSVKDAVKASSEVVKKQDNPFLSGPIYPLMQALDEEYLGVDAQFGGLDQRKILVFAREFLPKIGYRSRIELMNPMIRGLSEKKLSSSSPSSPKFLDDPDTLKSKINKAECVPGDANNGLLPLAKYVLLPLQKKFIVSRPAKFGGPVTYDSYELLEKDFVNKKLHPMDLKAGVADALIVLLKPFRENAKLIKLYKEAYVN